MTDDNNKRVPPEVRGNFNPNESFFFLGSKVLIVFLLLIGILSSLFLFLDNPDNIFKALGILISVLWLCILLAYFFWAIFHYNIFYGKTKKFWDKVIDARERYAQGLEVKPSELEAPIENPYRGQTFGLPKGTVRGMIAFTLLFGAITLLLVSMGADSSLGRDSFFWDHFEFFETAFLMMIAFYFGSHSLKYLQNRWRKSSLEDESDENRTISDYDVNTATNQELEDNNLEIDKYNEEIDVNSSSETPKKPKPTAGTGLIPIIDAGHGGLINGKYVTAPSKMYTFEQDNTVIYEGVINRQIGKKLITLLDEERIPYHDLTVSTNEDTPLNKRVAEANALYEKNKKYYYLSIHSNASTKSNNGKGNPHSFFVVITSTHKSKSDEIAKIAGKNYETDFPEKKYWGHWEKDDYSVLVYTHCPAIIVENLFFDNKEDAEYLMSEEGQQAIAQCLFKTVKEVYESYI